MAFHEQPCTPCAGGLPPLSEAAARGLAVQVPDWQIADGATRLVRRFPVPDYAQALAFVTALSAIAEAEGHHPDVCFGWGYVTVSMQTHAIKGLHQNDFLLAAKIDRLAGAR
ncbi:MAG: 4a-hydroxytetrahydrobiopterin dehydratase [Rhodospirillaceae bacterium]